MDWILTWKGGCRVGPGNIHSSMLCRLFTTKPLYNFILESWMEAAKNTPLNMAPNKGRCVAWNVSVIAAVGRCDLSEKKEKRKKRRWFAPRRFTTLKRNFSFGRENDLCKLKTRPEKHTGKATWQLGVNLSWLQVWEWARVIIKSWAWNTEQNSSYPQT